MMEYHPNQDGETSSSDSSGDEFEMTNGMEIYWRGVREGQMAFRRIWAGRNDREEGGKGESEEEHHYQRDFHRLTNLLERVKVGGRGEEK